MLSDAASHNKFFNTALAMLFRDEPLHITPSTSLLSVWMWMNLLVQKGYQRCMVRRTEASSVTEMCSCTMFGKSNCYQTVNKKSLLQN